MPKLKYITGLYLNMPESPTTEDIEYYIASENKKVLDKEKLVKMFGAEKSSQIDECLREMTLNLRLQPMPEGEGKYKVM